MRHCSQTTYNKSCQAPMGCFFKRLLGGNTRRVIFLPMASRAHVVACMPCQAHALMSHCGQTTYHKSCQAPMGWFFKRLLGRNTRRVVFLPMACRAHVVACMPCQAYALMSHCGHTTYHKSCQAPIGWFFKRLLGGRPRRMVFLPMACRAHVVACMPCLAHAVAFLLPMSRHGKPCGCMPCQAKVVACLVKPMS